MAWSKKISNTKGTQLKQSYPQKYLDVQESTLKNKCSERSILRDVFCPTCLQHATNYVYTTIPSKIAKRKKLRFAAKIVASTRVNFDTIAKVDEYWHLNRNARLQGCRLSDVRYSVALYTWLSISYF